jgi:hypothetical protein
LDDLGAKVETQFDAVWIPNEDLAIAAAVLAPLRVEASAQSA